MDIQQLLKVMLMKQLKVKDNVLTRKEDFFGISGVVKSVADKTLDQLAKEGIFVFPEQIQDTDDLTKDQMILQSINDYYRTGNAMGFLGVGDERLIISSRFANGEEDFLFQYLLEKVLDFPNIIDLKTNVSQDNKVFNMMLFLFPYFLKKATRKGLLKTYIRNEYNNENVRGTIDVARHVKKNTPFTGNIAYSQREYAYDNDLMELIRHTIEFIKSKSFGNVLLGRVKDEVKLVIDATGNFRASDKRKIIEANKKNVVRHAYYHDYRELQTICIFILQNQKHQIGLGNRKAYGILFDGAWLWEEYLNTLISDEFYHPMNKAGKDAEWLFTKSSNNKAGLIYPDFISKDKGRRVIADAKYKPQDNVGNKDYLQMLAYMFRFDAKQGTFLYPEVGDDEELRLHMNSGISCETKIVAREDIIVMKLGLRIPEKAKNYDEFVTEMKTSEETFKAKLKYVI